MILCQDVKVLTHICVAALHCHLFFPKLRTTVDRQILARVGKGHNNQSYQLEQEFVYHFDCVWFTYDIFRVYSIV